MASTYSTNLAIELIGTGDQAGSWGNTTNTNLGTLIEQAISGYVTQAVSTGTDTTITIPNGATGVARNMYIELTGTGGASTNLIVPANKKLYFIFNNTSSGQVTVKVSGQTGVSVPNGKKMVLVSNGTDVVVAENYIADFGSNSATITNLTCTSLTLSNNPTFGAGTANGVLYLNGSKVATSGTALTFDGTNFSSTGTATVNSGNSSSVGLVVKGETGNGIRQRFIGQAASGQYNWQIGASITAAGEFAFMPSTAADGTTFTSSVYNITPTGVSYWSVGGSEQMRLTSTGLGIGTASPSVKLDVQGGSINTSSFVTITPTTATNNALYRATNTGGTFYAGLDNSAGGVTGTAYSGILWHTGAYPISFGTNSAERMRLDSSGNLGIGTTSPANYANYRNLAISGTTGGNIDMLSGSTKVGNLFNDGTNFYAYNVIAGALVFGTNNAERARFDASGNLGIGTASPTQKLEVAGSGNAFVSNGQAIVSAGSGISYSARLSCAYNFPFVDTYLDSVAGASYSGQIIFRTSSGGGAMTERMRLDSSGNLGLGVTPSATSGSYKNIQNGGLVLMGIAGGADAYVNGNATFNSGWKYISNGFAARYSMNDAAGGVHAWFTAPSGTAGGTISFTQAMTLDASGNLGIGTSSPGNYSGAANNLVIAGSGQRGMTIATTNGGQTSIFFADADSGTGEYAGAVNYFHSDDHMEFYTASAERLRITSGGDLLVGTTSNAGYGGSVVSKSASDTNPLAVLNPSATNPYGIAIGFTGAAPNDATRLFLGCADNAATRAQIRSNGGLANYQANDVNLSDERTKKDIVPLGSMWDKFKAIEIVAFKYKDQTHEDNNIGVIAQQVESVAPEFVDVDGFGDTPEDGVPLKSIYTADMYHAAIKALQEAMARIEQLEAKFAALESK